MKTVIWTMLLGALLNIEMAFGSATPARTVLFPDDSAEETSQGFDSSKLEQPQQTITKPNGKNPTTNYSNANGKMKFRIDSSDIPCIKNTTMFFCEELANQEYPTEYVETMLANTDAQTYSKYFNKTVASDDALGVRISSDTSIELCTSFKRIIYPQVAVNIENDWRFVIQSTQSKQSIRVEICQKQNSKCLFSETFPNGYVSACIQKHTKVPLLSLGENGELVSYDYAFPSFCQCEIHYKQTNRLSGRHRF